MNRLGIAGSPQQNMKLVKSSGFTGLGDVQLSGVVSNDFLRKHFQMLINFRNDKGQPFTLELRNNIHAVLNWGPSATQGIKDTAAYYREKGTYSGIPLILLDFQALFPAEFARLQETGALYEGGDLGLEYKNYLQQLIQEAQALAAAEEEKRRRLVSEYENDMAKGQSLLSGIKITINNLGAAKLIVDPIRNSPFSEFKNQANSLFKKIAQAQTSLGNTQGQLQDTITIIQQKLSELQ